jgi:hypothetical protein
VGSGNSAKATDKKETSTTIVTPTLISYRVTEKMSLFTKTSTIFMINSLELDSDLLNREN